MINLNKKILSGSFWLSFGSIFSRILGVVYLIPWLIMLGSYHNQLNAQAIFNSSYTPYALFLSVGTAGLPSVIAREVAALNSQKRYRDSVYLTKLGWLVMVVMGLFCGAVLYFSAPLIAQNSPVESVSQATFSIRVLVPAVIVLPSMSMVRGWFQGNNDMKPYGISQLWEQFARILFILLATFSVVEVFRQNYVLAVYLSVFGAFIGALASYVYLLVYGKKQLTGYRKALQDSKPRTLDNVMASLMQLWYHSIPFVLLGAFITLTQFVDQVFFKQILLKTTNWSQEYVSYLYTVFSANPSKITTVIISLATAVSETSLPLLSGLRANGKKQGIKDLLLENYRLLLFVLLPLVTLATFASAQIYTVLFSHDLTGSFYLMQNIIQSLFLALTMNVLTLLLALSMNQVAVVVMLVGLAVKLVLQVPLLTWYQTNGAIAATNVAMLLVIIVSYYLINREYEIDLWVLWKLIATNIGFFLLVAVYYFVVGMRFDSMTSRMHSFLYLVVYGIVGLLVYIWLTNKTDVSEQILGQKVGYKYYKYKHYR
ncbi:polysaccharide transporter [Lactobacillus gigeriorum DSM 23908 = CRBIP 24.85]|uniref:Polysaccharide transporter n=1 Tax=Lactobacillus gigeriorum DSM 23908 = CRBIP 24.85 TaxID=1423751 RepID=A0ABR5PTL9_9LACO|nr:polysaccharide transporter [Lactobacillus gigeriorum DSM 23908 = CRBIP 24.85]